MLTFFHWSILFVPFFIVYMVFYNYRYLNNGNFPKEQHHTDRQIMGTVDVMIHHEVKETTTMRLLSLADLDLKRKNTPFENSPFIIVKSYISKYDHRKEFTDNKSSSIGRHKTCFYNHAGLGRVSINRTILSLAWVDRQYPVVGHGGSYTPQDCLPRHKVAVIVPYMNRPENLATFLFNIHPFLIKQKIEYRIFVIEQYGHGSPFRKGRLFNAGFAEAQKLSRWKCVIFHEVDLLPLDSRVLYTCPIWPRQMSATVVNKMELGLPQMRAFNEAQRFLMIVNIGYDSMAVKNPPKMVTLHPTRNHSIQRSLFGGVTSMTPEQFIKVNGYSNDRYLGEEGFDIFWRLRRAGFSISRYNQSIAQYTELSRFKDPFGNRSTLRNTEKYIKTEGLKELKYTIIKIEAHHLYTRILVDVVARS